MPAADSHVAQSFLKKPLGRPMTSISSDSSEAPSERDSLRAYVDDSDSVVRRTIRRYTKFARQCFDGSVNRLFKRIAVDHGVYLYEEKSETTSSSSFVHEICPGGRRFSNSSERPRRRSRAHGRMTQLNAFGGGELPGTLQEVMSGLYADNEEDHAANCSVQFGQDKVVDCGIMETFDRADEANPYRYLGVKWLEVESSCDDDSKIIDELYWIERTGIYTTTTGREFGFQLIKTVDSDYSMDEKQYRSINMSVCYLYHQIEADVVHVFARGIVEIPHDMNTDATEVIKQASELMLAPTRVRQCQRMKMISKMIERSKTDRENMLVCRCSKVVRGLPRVELCSDCRAVMQECKLVAVKEAPQRRRQLQEHARTSLSSTASTLSERSSASSPSSSPSSSTHHLASRSGTVRRDGEVSDETDMDMLSLRMLLPIRESRSSSAYREKKKRQGNILLKMLERYEDERRLKASDYIPPSDE